MSTPPEDRSPLLLKVDDAAQQLGVSERTLWMLIGLGDLPVVRLSKRVVRIRREDVVALIERRLHRT